MDYCLFVGHENGAAFVELTFGIVPHMFADFVHVLLTITRRIRTLKIKIVISSMVLLTAFRYKMYNYNRY